MNAIETKLEKTKGKLLIKNSFLKLWIAESKHEWVYKHVKNHSHENCYRRARLKVGIKIRLSSKELWFSHFGSSA